MEAKQLMTGKLALKAQELAKLDLEISSFTEQLDQLKERKAKVEADLFELMQVEDMVRFSVDQVGTVYLRTTFYPKVTGDPEKAIEYLDSLGFPEVSPRTVNSARLRELIMTRQENNEKPLPEDLFQAVPITKVKILKSSK